MTLALACVGFATAATGNFEMFLERYAAEYGARGLMPHPAPRPPPRAGHQARARARRERGAAGPHSVARPLLRRPPVARARAAPHGDGGLRRVLHHGPGHALRDAGVPLALAAGRRLPRRQDHPGGHAVVGPPRSYRAGARAFGADRGPGSGADRGAAVDHASRPGPRAAGSRALLARAVPQHARLLRAPARRAHHLHVGAEPEHDRPGEAVQPRAPGLLQVRVPDHRALQRPGERGAVLAPALAHPSRRARGARAAAPGLRPGPASHPGAGLRCSPSVCSSSPAS